MRRHRVLLPTILLLLFVPSSSLFGQAAAQKRPLPIEDYGRWRSITSADLSDNGAWVHYAYRTPDADDTLYVASLVGGTEYMVPLGQRPAFSEDARWVAYIVATPYEEAEKLREDRDPVPQHAELMNLQTGEKTRWENVASISFAETSEWLALKKPKADREAEHDGTDLILRNLSEGWEELLGSVSEFSFNKPGTWLAWTVDAADRTGNGLYLMNLETGVRRPADNDTLIYSSLTWDEEGRAVAALKGSTPEGKVQRVNAVVSVRGLDRNRPATRVFVPTTANGLLDSLVISERGSLTWSEDLATVFVGLDVQEAEPPRNRDEEVANVDIWHWADDRLQSVQMLQANRDRNFTYLAAVRVDDGRLIQLADETMKNVSLTRSGRWGVGTDDRAYVSDWEESRADYHRVDTRTGARTPMFREKGRMLGLSPDSRWALFWEGGQVEAYDLDNASVRNITQAAPVSFVNEQYDHPGTKPPHGVAGWSEDGRSLLLYDRYDMWRIPLERGEVECLTGGRGAAEEIQFRYVQLDPEERTIDLSDPLLLSAYGQWTKKAGFYRLQRGRLTELVYEDASFGRPSKAEDADRLLYTFEDFQHFGDYHVSGLDFANRQQVTDAIPFQDEYFWGHSELIDYTNNDGVRLQGVLMIPETYRPGQRLPMLVDFYEKNSQSLNRYPRVTSRDTPMFSKYMSNGYLVLLPDVHFRTRTTHSDHLECVEAAIRKVIELGYVDPTLIGLHGHSFSGQGSAYISTHSTMFAAICYGAGATDLVADFNQLWKSSGTNQHRYDIYGQGRFGTNPFDDLQLYIDQSAVFHARDMNTPLLILHGTADGSVEWLQGVEFYNALRFNGKNVIMCSYPDEPHHLAVKENQVDFQNRMEQFFDHYLKGEPAPDWMINGIPFLKKAYREGGGGGR